MSQYDETYAERPTLFPVEVGDDSEDRSSPSPKRPVATDSDRSRASDSDPDADEENEYDIDSEPITPDEADRLLQDEGY